MRRIVVAPSATAVRAFSRAVEGVPRMSAVHHPYDLTAGSGGSSAITPGNDRSKRFAVIEFSGRQYKVAENDVIVADYLKHVDIGQQLALDRVMLVGSASDTYVGHPYLDSAAVHATVEEITEGDKVVIFKKRRRKNSKRTRGFRRDVVTLRIDTISFRPEDITSTSRKSTTAATSTGGSGGMASA